jgi:hypothetical protein
MTAELMPFPALMNMEPEEKPAISDGSQLCKSYD